MNFKDYYKILGVSRTASDDEIRRAYRKLARRYHPDVSKEPDAEQTFRDINEAYEVLKDADKRAKYDAVGDDWRGGRVPHGAASGWQSTGPGFEDEPFGAGFDGASGFSAFFDMLFGRGAGRSWGAASGATDRRAAPPGADAEAAIELTLEEAARGGIREMTLQDPATGTSKRLRVRIPAGVRDGQRIRCAGQGGQAVAGGSRGDLYLRVRVRPDSRFRVDGDDLLTTVSLSPAKAALGTVATVPTLEGRVQVKVPQGSSSGRKIRLRGKGLKSRDGRAGDLFVEVKIVVPTQLSKRERELYEELDRLTSKGSREVA